MASEKLSLSGFVVHIGETEVITEKFQKREIIIETRDNPNYPETILFEAHQDRVDLLDPYEFGDEVKVHFNVKGRSVQMQNGLFRNFNTLQAWRVEAIGETAAKRKSNSPGMQQASTASVNPPNENKSDKEDDFPF